MRANPPLPSQAFSVLPGCLDTHSLLFPEPVAGSLLFSGWKDVYFKNSSLASNFHSSAYYLHMNVVKIRECLFLF